MLPWGWGTVQATAGESIHGPSVLLGHHPTCPQCPKLHCHAFAFTLSASSGTGTLSAGGYWTEAASPCPGPKHADLCIQVLVTFLHATSLAVVIVMHMLPLQMVPWSCSLCFNTARHVSRLGRWGFQPMVSSGTRACTTCRPQEWGWRTAPGSGSWSWTLVVLHDDGGSAEIPCH
jgi:hypothetical protein